MGVIHKKTSFLGWLVGVLAVVGLGLLTSPLQAQESSGAEAALVEGADARALRSLLATLEDDAQRTAFLSTLRTALTVLEQGEAAEAPPPVASEDMGTQFLTALSQTLSALGEQVSEFGQPGGPLDQAITTLIALGDTPEERFSLLQTASELAFVLGLGLVALVVLRRSLARSRERLDARIRESRPVERAFLTVLHVALDLIPPLVMVGLTWVLLPLLNAQGGVQVGAMLLALALAVYHGVVRTAETVLAPQDDRVRLFHIGGETAQYLLIWAKRLAGVAIVGYFILQGAALLGLPLESYKALARLLGLVIATLLVVLVLQNRQPVRQWIGQGTEAPKSEEDQRRLSRYLRRRLADLWHILAGLYIVAAYVVWAMEVEGGFLFLTRATTLSVMILGGMALLMRLTEAGLRRAFTISAEVSARYPGIEARANRYLPFLHRVVRTVIGVIATLALLQAWGVPLGTWLTLGAGQRLTSAILTIAVVLLLALLAWETLNATVERYFNKTDESGKVVERSARAKTLMPLARNVVLIVLAVVTGLVVLSELGINIAPLLAGAGVIGLAVGFGSQKLVQDVITGIFILFEETISVGDMVQVGGYSGTVEGLNIRSLRLRDAHGSVHTIPFSGVDKVTNLTKDFSYAVLDIGIAYREDTDAVAEVVRDLGADLAADPEYGAQILDPLEIIGVDRFEDSAVILRARIKTRPAKQWWVRREFNRRMKKRFDELGIEIPFPYRTVVFGVEKDGTAPPARLLLDWANRPQGRGAKGDAIDLPMTDLGPEKK